MRFSVHFDSIPNEKWLFSYRNNDSSCMHARGHAPQRENLEKMCNLVRLQNGRHCKVIKVPPTKFIF